MGIKHQLKKVKIPGLSAVALSACLTFLEPVLNLQKSRPIMFLLRALVVYKCHQGISGLARLEGEVVPVTDATLHADPP